MSNLAPLPSADELEIPVIGLIILFPADSLPRCMQALDLQAFHHPLCRAVYAHCLNLFAEGKSIDLAIITHQMMLSGELEKLGGPSALFELCEHACVSASLLDEYIPRLVAMRQRRQLIRAAETLAAEARDGAIEPETALGHAQGNLLEVLGVTARGARSLKQVGIDVMKDIDNANRNRGHVTRGLATGYADLDRQLMGLTPGALMVIGGRPAMGKSTLLMNIAENIALDDHGVLVFTLEMPDKQLVNRMLVGGAQIDLQKSRSGMFGQGELGKIRERYAKLATAPMWIYDQPGLTIGEIRARVRIMCARHTIKAVFIDYLQLLKGDSRRGRDNRVLEIKEIANGMKNMALEEGIACVTAAQLNRAAEDRRDHKPMMADLRESGDIEQEADIIGLLRRPGYYAKKAAEGKGNGKSSTAGWDGSDEETDPADDRAYLDIAKNRDGPTGECEFRFLDRFTRFINPDGKKLWG